MANHLDNLSKVVYNKTVMLQCYICALMSADATDGCG